ncbi:MAG TPA: hypothetical protein VNB49_17095, partial [Candidatus Dormibacteraeota bacterium]|nr:hypothetical protein [Candidatus Dormibacteraeota bacterium]
NPSLYCTRDTHDGTTSMPINNHLDVAWTSMAQADVFVPVKRPRERKHRAPPALPYAFSLLPNDLKAPNQPG